MSVRRWWPRVVAAALGLAFALAPAAPALAHSVGGVGATNFQTSLSAITPAVAGLSLRVIENGSRLELRNDTATDVIVAGYGGEPYARVGPAGVFLNDNSPATYLNVDRFATAIVPASADGKGPPVWRQVSADPLLRWHDHRVHWMLKTLPPAVAADPGAAHRISAWTVVLQYGDQRLTATGTLDWVPGPSPWPWFALVVLVAGAVAAAAYLARPHRVLAAAVGLLFAADFAHGFGAMVATAGTMPQKLSALFGNDALLIWPFALVTGWLLARRRTRAAWLAAGLGALVTVEMVIDDVPVWWRSSSPSALPPNVNRAAVALVVGLGVGLIVVLPLLLRRHRPADRPWAGNANRGWTPARVPSESVPSGSVPSGFVPSERVPSERVPSERVPSERVPSERVPSERVPSGRVPSGSVPSGSVPSERMPSGSATVGPAASALETDAGSAGRDADPPVEARPGFGIGRRQVAGLFAAGAIGALAGATVGATAANRSGAVAPAPTGPLLSDVGARSIAFRGERQAGIIAPARPQAHAWVAAFDLEPGVPATALRDLLKRWSNAADRLMAGQPLGGTDDAVVAGLGPSALTVTIGFGPSLFGRAGVPAAARPAALQHLPAFAGERLDPARSDGDLGVVVAGDDPVVVTHAARVLRRLAATTAHVRWQMSGFNAARGAGSETATARNLMGQLDGTNNPQPSDPDFEARIFVGPGPASSGGPGPGGAGSGGPSPGVDTAGAPAWLRGGSYLVVRRIRMLLDNWDALSTPDQERVIGRRRDNGAPLTGGSEQAAADFGARAADGSLVIPADAHMRLAAPAANEGAAILRRGFSYVDGAESGLLFLAWQADPRRGFIPVQQRLVTSDALSRFIRHETSALFAMPGGVGPGGYVGQALLEP